MSEETKEQDKVRSTDGQTYITPIDATVMPHGQERTPESDELKEIEDRYLHENVRVKKKLARVKKERDDALTEIENLKSLLELKATSINSLVNERDEYKRKLGVARAALIAIKDRDPYATRTGCSEYITETK